MPEATPTSRYCVGIVSHRTSPHLDRCLVSIADQNVPPAAVYVLDGEAHPERFAELCDCHSGVRFEAGPNRGYAGGANRILARVAAEEPASAFCLLLNPDVVLERHFAERLLGAMDARPDVAIATGKLLRPDGRTIDSAGIALPRHGRPRDRGSEQLDRGQLDAPGDVFGASGAAMLLRRAALDALALDGEVFDEDFFLYHEDTDLCWRAWRLGWRVHYEPSARAVHVRGWRRPDRFSVPVAVRRHSFKNHYLQLLKNASSRDLLRDLPVLATWEVLRLGYAMLRDPGVLPAYADAWRLRGRTLAKRRLLDAKASRADRGAVSIPATSRWRSAS